MRSMPPSVQRHGDAGGAGVERVLHQLLHRGGRALDHLAGGDAVDGVGGQDADGGHGLAPIESRGENIARSGGGGQRAMLLGGGRSSSRNACDPARNLSCLCACGKTPRPMTVGWGRSIGWPGGAPADVATRRLLLARLGRQGEMIPGRCWLAASFFIYAENRAEDFAENRGVRSVVCRSAARSVVAPRFSAESSADSPRKTYRKQRTPPAPPADTRLRAVQLGPGSCRRAPAPPANTRLRADIVTQAGRAVIGVDLPCHARSRNQHTPDGIDCGPVHHWVGKRHCEGAVGHLADPLQFSSRSRGATSWPSSRIFSVVSWWPGSRPGRTPADARTRPSAR